MRKRLLTLDDLCDYYSNKKKAIHFSSSESNSGPIVVQTMGKMKFEENEDSTLDGLCAVSFQHALHSGQNLNRSYISKEVLEEKLLPTFVNRPILGYIHYIDDVPYFKGHEMHTDPDTDEIVYDEIPVGVIPETNNAQLVYDEEKDHYNVLIDGYIYEEYTKAAEIIKRENECSVSVEIAIKEMSYAPKDNILVIEDGYFSGITILGLDNNGNEIHPGMEGSKVTLKDFSAKNNSLMNNISSEENEMLINTLEKLNTTLSSLYIENNGKEESEAMDGEKLINEEETDLEINANSETSDDEKGEDPEVIETLDDDSDEEETGEEGTDEDETDGGEDGEEKDDDTEDETSEEKYTRTYTFELSHEDVKCGLYMLLEPYENADNEWYWISDVYDDYFIYEGWEAGKIYRQGYTKDDTNDTVELSGERVELFRELLTASEKAELEQMRNNYSLITKELNEYKDKELESQREEIMADEAYAEYLNTDEFKNIRSNIKSYSLEELRTQCELAYAKLIRKTTKLNFSKSESEKKSPFVGFCEPERETSFLDGILKNSKK